MLTQKEITLQAALQDFGLKDLPRMWDKNVSTMIDGIALVTKVGGTKEYVKVSFDGEEVIVVRDYGTCASIINIDKVYAVNVLDKKFTPDLRSDKAIVTFLGKKGYDETVIESLLSKDGKTPEQSKSDRAKVKKYVNLVALALAKKELAERDRCNEIRNYAKRIKNGKETDK